MPSYMQYERRLRKVFDDAENNPQEKIFLCRRCDTLVKELTKYWYYKDPGWFSFCKKCQEEESERRKVIAKSFDTL